MFTADAPFVPLPDGIENQIIKMMQLTNDSVLYDLGCGDARVLIAAAKEYPEIKAIGIEISVVPYLIAVIKTRKYKNITIQRSNFFKTDVSSATHIFMYLYPQVVEKLMPMIKNECKKGVIVASLDFNDKNTVPEKIIPLECNHPKRGNNLFIYSI